MWERIYFQWKEENKNKYISTCLKRKQRQFLCNIKILLKSKPISSFKFNTKKAPTILSFKYGNGKNAGVIECYCAMSSQRMLWVVHELKGRGKLILLADELTEKESSTVNQNPQEMKV